MPEPDVEFFGQTTPAIEGALRRELVGPFEGGGEGPLGGIDPELLQQINLLADQFGLTPEGAAALLTATQGDLLTREQAGNILLGIDTGGGTGAGAGNALGYAQLAETQRNNAFNRVYDKIRLLSATDDLQEARRENVMAAMLEAAPMMVNPGTEFTPGFEPGGPAMQLSNLIGANLQPQPMPTFELPVQEMLNAPTAVTPGLIEQQLGALQ